MREFGKYLVVMFLEMILVGLLVADAFAQVKIEYINYKFTGEKSRFEIELSQPTQYLVIEDWEDKTVSIVLPHIMTDNSKGFKLNEAHDYIVSRAEVLPAEIGLKLAITTEKDFTINFFTRNDKQTLYLDVYLAQEKPDANILMNRGLAYEKRNEFKKAVKQYQRALVLRPVDRTVLAKLSAAEKRLNIVNAGEKSATGNNSPILALLDSYTAAPMEEFDGTILEPQEVSALNPETTAPGIDEQSTVLRIKKALPISDNSDEQPSQSPILPESVNDQADFTNTEIQAAATVDNYNSESKTGMMIGFQELLKKSGTEIFVLIGLYIVVGLLTITVAMLARRLLKLRRLSRKQKRYNGKPGIPARSEKKPAQLNDKKIVSSKHIREVRQFARKLSEMYTRTDIKEKFMERKSGERNDNDIVMDHSHKIETAFNEIERSPYDSESIRLTKKFRTNNILQKSSGDKYDAVRQLGEQDWENWEIARELSMGIEEVKMALGLDAQKQNLASNDELFDRLSRAADQEYSGLSPSEIAEKLNIGEEEVRLALKLREKQSAEMS